MVWPLMSREELGKVPPILDPLPVPLNVAGPGAYHMVPRASPWVGGTSRVS